MAEGFAKAIAPSYVEVFSSEAAPEKEVASLVVKTMKAFDISTSYPDLETFVSDPVSESHEFDIVIIMSEIKKRQRPWFRGMPSIVNWNINEPDFSILSESEQGEVYLKKAKKIRQLVEGFFLNGYLSAFLQKKINTDNILNSLSEGLLAHDLNRKIFYFSDKAVELTGVPRESVIGHDCHEIFEGGICGENCSFCNGITLEDFSLKTYPVSFGNGKGQKKECDLSVVPLKDENRKIFGVVASFKDKSELHMLKMRNKELNCFRGIIGSDASMIEVYQQIKDVADYDFPVHIFGETGTGKELVAAAIHNESPRKNKPFVPVNCGALPGSLIESELFGHVRGAFSGAVKEKKGRFELAEGGTIFLDEIGELPRELQVKLLRFLQEGTFEKVGGEKTFFADVRVISATNRDLKKEVGTGTFREDVYYRLNVIPVRLPALRDKKNDIPLLVAHFCDKISGMRNKPVPDFSEQAISAMMVYDWPGNVRELENAVQYSIVRSRGNVIMPEHLPMEFDSRIIVLNNQKEFAKKEPSKKLSTDSVKAALKEAGGNKSKAAKLLGVGRATLYRFIDANKVV